MKKKMKSMRQTQQIIEHLVETLYTVVLTLKIYPELLILKFGK